MEGRQTSHPTGDHWIAPSQRSLFVAPPEPPPAPTRSEVRSPARHTSTTSQRRRSANERTPEGHYTVLQREAVLVEAFSWLRDLTGPRPAA